jgi:hypothetical protein
VLLAISQNEEEVKDSVTTATLTSPKHMRAVTSSLLRGIERAIPHAYGCGPWPAGDIGAAVTAVVLRMVFLLFAEARGRLEFPPRLSPAELHRQLEALPKRVGTFGGWYCLLHLWQALHLARGGRLFDPCLFPWLSTDGKHVPAIDDEAVYGLLRGLMFVEGVRVDHSNLDVETLGYCYEALMDLRIECVGGKLSEVAEDAKRGKRRRTGSSYTPRSLAERVVLRTLEPLFLAMGPEPDSRRLLDLRIADPAVGTGVFPLSVCRLLGAKVAEAWEREGHVGRDVSAGEALSLAKRCVAKRCIYAVDKNPDAVEIAALSLWLECEASGEPFTFVDHRVLCGDALVGLDLEQLKRFHWDPSKAEPCDLIVEEVDKALKAAAAARERIRELAAPSWQSSK